MLPFLQQPSISLVRDPKQNNKANIFLDIFALFLGVFAATASAGPNRRIIGCIIGTIVCACFILITSFILKMHNKNFLMYPFCGHASGNIRSYNDFIKVFLFFCFLLYYSNFIYCLLAGVRIDVDFISQNRKRRSDLGLKEARCWAGILSQRLLAKCVKRGRR